MPHVAWSLVRTMAFVFAVICLAQLILSLVLLGLHPGRGSYALIIVQLALVLAFAGLSVYANSQLRASKRSWRQRGGRSV